MFRFIELPFTYHWIVRNAIGNGVRSVLDVGCGEGEFTKEISQGERWKIYGIDIYPESVNKAKLSGVYKSVVVGDLVQISKSIANRKYDIVLASQVIEHLTKDDSLTLIAAMEKLALKRVVVTTPVGFIEYDPIDNLESKENPFQKHLSGWSPEDFTKRNYRVFGQGVKFVWRPGGLAHKFPKALPICFLISFVFAPLVYFFPKLGTYMICVRKI